jgi:6-pyruvoyltetrahydropterin/6-carboxytetrahydropterin synthase
MNFTIMRKIEFCAGHRLVGHEGKCANIHGHNYVVQIHVSGTEVDSVGRIVDFAVINRLFKTWIDENWDHGVILWDGDEAAIAALNQVQPNRVFCLPYNPSAENLARYLLTEVAPNLISRIEGYYIEVTRVIVWETEHSFAEVSLPHAAPNFLADINKEGTTV